VCVLRFLGIFDLGKYGTGAMVFRILTRTVHKIKGFSMVRDWSIIWQKQGAAMGCKPATNHLLKIYPGSQFVVHVLYCEQNNGV
jgi:hypothetical protein